MTYSYDQNTRRCGPAACAYVLGVPLGEVLDRWPGGWKDTDSVWDDLNDHPDDHRLLVEAYGKFQQMVTLTDIIGEQCPKDKTVVLIHFSHTAKHWVVWHDTDERGVLVHWGNGTIKHIPFDKMVSLFKDSMPNCAYTIVDQPPKLSWWQRFRRWFLGKIARWT